MKLVVLFILCINCAQVVRAQYVASAALSVSNQSNITIDGKSFKSGGTLGVSIYLSNCSNVKITNCEFQISKDIIGVQLQNCSNVEISGCYFRNFRTGVYAVKCTGGINIHCNTFDTIAGAKPRGQMVQFNACSGAGNRINYNILNTPIGVGGAEDLINLYASYGTASDPIQVNGNHLRGGGPSTSGGGIMLGDNGSHDIFCDGNILVEPGQYGISAPSGSNIVIKNNTLYSAQHAWTNVGIYVGLQGEIDAGFACDGASIQVLNNQVNWTNKNGVKNAWYNCPCCSGVIQSGNNFRATITSSILPTKLMLNATQCPTKAFTVTQYIVMTQGWNLISINVTPTDSSIASLFNSLAVLEIKDMNSFWRKGQADVFNRLKSLTVGNGYLVNMNSGGTLKVIGTPIVETSRALSLPQNQWQLLGCPFQTATPFLNNFNASNCSVIKNFEGFWKPTAANNSISSFEPTKGYFIKQ